MNEALHRFIDDPESFVRGIVREEMERSSRGQMLDDDEPLTAEEAAKLLGVSRWRVYEMVKQNLLTAYHPSPNTIRIRRGAVRALKESKTT